MSLLATPVLKVVGQSPSCDDARDIVRQEASNEFVFAVVGHAGSGTSLVATALAALIADESVNGERFRVSSVKARDVIKQWADRKHKQLPEAATRTIEDVVLLQDYGDEMRSEIRKSGKADYSSVARGLIKSIQQRRISLDDDPKQPRAPHAYILDSIRHPAEVELLRYTYGDAFVLIGVVCAETKRVARIKHKYECSEPDARRFMERDANDDKKHGQHVADVFHLADFFVDNTVDRYKPNREPNPAWKVTEDLNRLVKIITGTDITRPKLAETAMYHAFSSQMHSACLSRQVGAALVDAKGDILATGTNEVPKARGGVYGESVEGDAGDGRCAFRFDTDRKHVCSNTRRQNQIIEELLDKIKELQCAAAERKAELREEVRKTRIGSLLEFSRAVHAEMEAILSAARRGVSTAGTRLFVTTFPCHYCARHIVSAGIDEVQFIEPYPKSLAIDLHDDSIVTEASDWKPPSEGGTHVLFRPFSGVSPRLYKKAFMKTHELKNKSSGELCLAAPEWVSPWYLPVSSYLERERLIIEEFDDE
jgi:deoxycytidylate deaminase